MSVKYTNSPAYDARGCKKEFFLTLFLTFQRMTVEGIPFRRSLKFSFLHLRAKNYFYFGQAICLAVINNGPTVDFFSNTFFKILAEGKQDNFDIEDVSSEHIKQQLLQAKAATSYLSLSLNQAIAAGSVFEITGTEQQSGTMEDFVEKKNLVLNSKYWIKYLRQKTFVFPVI